MTSGFKKRLFLYAVAYAAWLGLLLAATGGFGHESNWPMSWIRWDSQQYQKIWVEGYANLKFLAHPPGYSLLIGALSAVTPFDFYTMARIVNVEAWFAAAVLAAELMLRLELIDAPLAFFALLLTYPAAFFILTSYSDAVFALMFWGAFFVALLYPQGKKARVTEFLLLMAAPWIRLTGYVFAAWCLKRRWTAIAVFISLAGWLALNYYYTGQASFFISASHTYYNMPEGGILDGARDALRGLPHFPHTPQACMDYLRYKLLPVVYFLALGVAGLWFCRRGQTLIGFTVLAGLFLCHNVSFWRATVRYDWPFAACLFVPLLHCAMNKMPPGLSRRVVYALLLLFGILQLALQIYFANLFRQRAYIWG